MSDQNVFAPLPSSGPEVYATGATVPWHAVGTVKMFVLSLLTLNIYLLYWFYKQWQGWNRVTGESIIPAARAFFSVIYAIPLARRVEEKASVGASLQIWGVLFVVFSLADRVMANVDVPGWIVVLTLVARSAALIPVQQEMNRQILEADPNAPMNTGPTVASAIAVLIGGVFTVALVIGALFL